MANSKKGRGRGRRGTGSNGSSFGGKSGGSRGKGRGGGKSSSGGRGKGRSRNGRGRGKSSQQTSAESALAPPPVSLEPYVPPKAAAPIAVHPDRLKAMEQRAQRAKEPASNRGNRGRNRNWKGDRGRPKGRDRGNRRDARSERPTSNPAYYSGPPVPIGRPKPGSLAASSLRPPPVYSAPPSSLANPVRMTAKGKRTLMDSVSTDQRNAHSSKDCGPEKKKRAKHSYLSGEESKREGVEDTDKVGQLNFDDCIIEGVERSGCKHCGIDVRRELRNQVEHLRNVCVKLPSEKQSYFRSNYDRNGERVASSNQVVVESPKLQRRKNGKIRSI